MQNKIEFSSNEITLGVVGAGIMGRGVAQIAVTAGVNVIINDMNGNAVQEAITFVNGMLDRAVEKGRMQQVDVDAAKVRLHASTDLQDLKDADVVVEAIVEKLDIKQSLFVELEKLVSADCILATNTSSLSVTAIASVCKKPERVAGCHFFNPVPLMKLVEVISGVRTADEVAQLLSTLVSRFGHTPVMVSDSPGFLVNHAGRGLITEGLRILHEGITQPHIVDEVMRDCVGFRMGPFELMDLIGLDVTFPASEQVYNQYFQEARVRPTPLQQRRYVAGLLGRKTQQGWYSYEEGEKIEPEQAVVPDIEPSSRFWVSREGEVEFQEKLISLLREAGAEIEKNDKPATDSIAIVTPLGCDVTTAAVNEGLDPERTIGVDLLFDTDKRLVLMSNPSTKKELIEESWALLARTGRDISLIKDSTGFIAQRIVATIVNIACDIAQQRIAKPADIDTGVKLGLAYPQGPLALGDSIGPQTILTILETLLTQSGDPRYRPSPWLQRRAKLGLSLLVDD